MLIQTHNMYAFQCSSDHKRKVPCLETEVGENSSGTVRKNSDWITHGASPAEQTSNIPQMVFLLLDHARPAEEILGALQLGMQGWLNP